MRSRASQFDVAHTVTTNFSLGHFDATLLTNHATMLQALVLATQTLVILHWAKDAGTEQAVALRLEGTVVNGFRLFYFAERPRTDHVWRRKTDFDGIKLFGLSLRFQKL